MGRGNQVNIKKGIRIIILGVIVCMIAGIWIFKNHEAVGSPGYTGDSDHTGSPGYVGSPADNRIEIKIFGAGCPKCKTLEKYVTAAVEEMGIDILVTKVTNIDDFLAYGIMLTPGLVINDEVKAYGRSPGKDEIIKFIQDEL